MYKIHFQLLKSLKSLKHNTIVMISLFPVQNILTK